MDGTAQTDKTKSKRKKLLAVAVGMVLFCVLCCSFVAISRPTERPKQAITEIADIPEATRALVPTATPKPTATSVPRFTVAEEVYTEKITGVLNTYSDVFTNLAKLFTAAGNDATLILDDEWRKNVVLVLATMGLANEDVRALNPPERFINTHSYLLNAAAHYDKAIYLCAEAVDSLDVDGLNQCMDEFELGTGFIDLAAEELDRLGKQ